MEVLTTRILNQEIHSQKYEYKWKSILLLMTNTLFHFEGFLRSAKNFEENSQLWHAYSSFLAGFYFLVELIKW